MKEEAAKLVEMVKKRMTDKEIMEKLGIQTKASLIKMYYDALVETGKIKDIISKQENTKTKKTLKIGKRGTLSLSKKLIIEELGFKEGDTFTVSQRKDGIILRKEKN